MEHLSTFFKIENDIGYRLGFKSGIEKSNAKTKKKLHTLFVKNLLTKTDESEAKIANLVGVTEDFVKNVKKRL